MQVVPIVMAGGSGTRLWPLSRDTMSKQFIGLLDGGISPFQATLRRVAGLARPIVVTNADFRFICAEQLAALGMEADIVLEPERRDSAAAVAVGTLLAAARQADALCLVLASDHLILDDAGFRTSVAAAAELARQGRILTIGIVPDHPSTAYGYIKPGSPLLGSPNAHVLDRFVEKPDRETAERYLAEGYLWNSGNLAYRADAMLGELRAHAPTVLAAAEAAMTKSTVDLDFIRLDSAAFAASPSVSIDYALMEKTRIGGVLEAGFDWSDIGSWASLFDARAKDGEGNVLSGDVVALDTRNSLVSSSGLLTAVHGLSDVVIVTTGDAVLVTSRARAGEVKALVAELKARGRPEAQEHLRIHRPWGWYQRIDRGDRFQVKHICVKPGGQLSLQRHHHRAEHWVVVHGTAEVTIDGAVRLYHENEAAYLPIGCVHRLRNPGKIDLKLIEVQVGSYTGEDDIVRIEDVYART
ncbi:mannose-1-phosphate guanylyltransferase/mannose-6-phosphate isomerase [Aurantimonas sp. MSK8Z-1]|uniref:mannose-1-phosphate guanylyltransferase/mannose-6-phosphate isomerase n=1 Tax=Mangrovibrevibacter kandeliae TaxID=2968473 RepID=UPI0021184A0C|nr:mannose-1-phosphate guanylyltransferase/mannose-6-phosphate isomerase [Aurantimonas sp. MSK8Z-1]MCW4116984.1 mannose-1-phosphate guanylyltransferase/mannose-6-phosphate isomerase [Aurantimonas sp. MSK8Z-1]